jgi:hypothetical protein
MTYQSTGLVQAADYNGFINTNTPNVNSIWSTGSGNSGYGQSTLASVSSGGIISATPPSSLIQTIIASANHQGSTISSFTDSTPSAGELILWESNLSTNINTINTNRLNAIAQGTTSSNVKTNSSAWSGSAPAYTLTMTASATFASTAQARYFFNAGGQLKLQIAHPPGSAQPSSNIDGYLYLLCGDCGTLVLSSPSGANTATIASILYTGTKKVGGAGTATVNTGIGFYDLSGSNSTLLSQYNTAYADYSSSTILVKALYSGSTINYTIEFTVNDSHTAPSYFDPAPQLGTTVTLTVAPPSTTYLGNSWGTVSLS